MSRTIRSGNTRQPLSMLDSDEHWSYVADWVQLAIEDDKFSCEPQQTGGNLRRGAHCSPRASPGSSGGCRFSSRYCRWSYVNGWRSGQRAKERSLFRPRRRRLPACDDISIEMGDLFQTRRWPPRCSWTYFFYRITQWLDGKRYTVIEIEECGFFFTYPSLRAFGSLGRDHSEVERSVDAGHAVASHRLRGTELRDSQREHTEHHLPAKPRRD